jgi:hypothetical protein
MSIEKDVATEIASELASLQAEQGSATEEAAPEADSVEGEPEASEELEETEDSEADEPLAEPDAGVDAVRDLIDAGDLAGAAKLLGLDPSVFKLNNRQFKAARVTAKEAKTAAAEASAKAALAESAQKQAETLNAKAEEIYGPVVAGKHHYRQGDVLKARAAMELMFEDTFENIVANMAKGAKAIDPAQLEVLKLRRELDAERAAKATETAAATEAQAQATELAGIAAKLKGTPLEALSDEAAADIQKVIRASYNKALGRYTKTLKEAYAEVKTGYTAKAAKLAALGKPAAKPATKPEVRKPLVAPRAPAKAAGLTMEQEFAMELKAAKAATAAADRRARRAR